MSTENSFKVGVEIEVMSAPISVARAAALQSLDDWVRVNRPELRLNPESVTFAVYNDTPEQRCFLKAYFRIGQLEPY